MNVLQKDGDKDGGGRKCVLIACTFPSKHQVTFL